MQRENWNRFDVNKVKRGGNNCFEKWNKRKKQDSRARICPKEIVFVFVIIRSCSPQFFLSPLRFVIPKNKTFSKLSPGNVDSSRRASPFVLPASVP